MYDIIVGYCSDIVVTRFCFFLRLPYFHCLVKALGSSAIVHIYIQDHLQDRISPIRPLHNMTYEYMIIIFNSMLTVMYESIISLKNRLNSCKSDLKNPLSRRSAWSSWPPGYHGKLGELVIPSSLGFRMLMDLSRLMNSRNLLQQGQEPFFLQEKVHEFHASIFIFYFQLLVRLKYLKI